MPAPILLLALAGGAAAFALSSKKAPAKSVAPSGVPTQNAGLPGGGPAASTLPGAGVLPPPDILKTIAIALQSANPTAMRAAADIVEKAGFGAQAADLRAAALAVEKATTSATATSVGQPVINTTGQTVPTPLTPPGAVNIVVPPPVTQVLNPNTGTTINLPAEVIVASANPKKDQAAAMALMLGSTSRFKENKSQVTAFQQANSAEENKSQAILKKPGKAATDGLYGTTTALTLARVYGIVPPAPFYYPTNPTPAKKAYMAEMAKFANSDPQRADEWNHAGESVRNM